jgi:uncharacterized protein
VNDAVLDEVATALRAAGARFALIFGSRARGDHRPTSDLDVAAWWPAQPPHAWDISLPDGVDLVTLPIESIELAGRIALEGTLLFDDDPAARVEWVATTRKIWLDERPRWEAAHREFLEAAARGR